MKNFKKLSKDQLKKVNGGLKWTSDRACNVIDRRAGAEAEWIQEIKNWWCGITS